MTPESSPTMSGGPLGPKPWVLAGRGAQRAFAEPGDLQLPPPRLTWRRLPAKLLAGGM